MGIRLEDAELAENMLIKVGVAVRAEPSGSGERRFNGVQRSNAKSARRYRIPNGERLESRRSNGQHDMILDVLWVLADVLDPLPEGEAAKLFTSAWHGLPDERRRVILQHLNLLPPPDPVLEQALEELEGVTWGGEPTSYEQMLRVFLDNRGSDLVGLDKFAPLFEGKQDAEKTASWRMSKLRILLSKYQRRIVHIPGYRLETMEEEGVVSAY
jgi:hypothetical protein